MPSLLPAVVGAAGLDALATLSDTHVVCCDLRRRTGNEVGEPTKVLGDSCKCELVLRAMGTSQTEAAEPEDALEVGEQHFDALPVAARLLKGLGLANGTGNIAGVLVDAAWDLARWLLRTASLFERAHIAIAFTRPIEQLLVIDDLARGGEDLISRTRVDVALPVK